MIPNPLTPAEVVLAQFGDALYVAMRTVAMHFTKPPDTAWAREHTTAASITGPAITLACPCGAELKVELNAGAGARIVRYCLPASHCTFVRLPTPQPPCGHWQPVPFEPATEGAT